MAASVVVVVMMVVVDVVFANLTHLLTLFVFMFPFPFSDDPFVHGAEFWQVHDVLIK